MVAGCTNEGSVAIHGKLATVSIISTPIPRLLLGPDDVLTDLDQAPQAWDAFVITGDDVTLLSVKPESHDAADGEILRGALAERCLQAAALADRELAHASASFGPTFIECAPAGLLSLVLRSRDAPTRYVKIVDGSLLDEDALELRSDLPELLKRMSAASTSSQVFIDFERMKGLDMKDTRVLFGGLIALILLGLYAFALVEAMRLALAESPGEFGVGFSHTLATVGGLISALIIAELAITRPDQLPGTRSFGGAAGPLSTQRRTAGIVGTLYVLAWILLGLAAYVVGAMLHPDKVKALTDFGQAWLGLAVAAGYAYFGVKP